jgi:hypothetical protein
MTWLKHILGVAAVLGIIAVASLPFSSAGGWAHMEQNIREAKTPADHQAMAAFYEQEAQTARELSAKHLAMRDSYATIPVLQEKGRAVDHCNAIARKYQEMAKDYAGLAEVHRRLAAQAKEGP